MHQHITPNIQDIIIEHVRFMKAKKQYDAFKELFISGAISDIGLPAGFYHQDLQEYLLNNHKIDIEVDSDIFTALANYQQTNNQALITLKASKPKIFHAMQAYANLNEYTISELLAGPEEAISLEDFERFYMERHEVLYAEDLNVDNKYTVKYKNMSLTVQISDASDIGQDTLTMWDVDAYLSHNDKIVGTLRANLLTTEYNLDNQSYFFAADEDSQFLADQAHAIISKYLEDDKSEHSDLNELYWGHDGCLSSGTLHIYEMNLDKKYRGRKLSYVMLETINHMMANTFAYNVNVAIDNGFYESTPISLLGEYIERIDLNDGFDSYNSICGISTLSLIAIDTNVRAFLPEIAKDDEFRPVRRYTEEEMDKAKQGHVKMSRYVEAFNVSLGPVGLDEYPDLTIFCNTTDSLGHMDGLLLLGSYMDNVNIPEESLATLH